MRQNTKKTICNCLVWPKQFNFGQCQLRKRCRAHQCVIKIVWFPTPLAAGSQMGTLSRWPREMQWDKSERNTSEKSTFQTSPNWRANLPRLEGVLFQGLGAWRIIFFYFRNHFLKIHTRGIPKMSNFYAFGPFLAEKTAVKEKKARFDPFVPPTHIQQQVGWGTRL